MPSLILSLPPSLRSRTGARARRRRPLAAALLALGALAAPLLAGAQATPQTGLPSTVLEALARARVPPEAMSLVVAPMPPAPGARGAAAQMPPPLLSWLPDVPRNPASVMKLVTTYAGLDMLGADWFWKTRIGYDGLLRNGVLEGNLVIEGGGDPKLVVERLEPLLRDVMARGVSVVRGDIVVDRSVFRLSAHDASAFDDDPLRPYNAGPDGMLVNFGALTIRLTPDAASRQALVSTVPPIGAAIVPAVPLAGSSCGAWRAGLRADYSAPGQIRFNGRYPSACGTQEFTIAYPDAPNFAPRVIEAMWRAAGGALTGQARSVSQRPGGVRPLTTGYSLPLAAVIADINKYSNNVMAQQLFLTLSAAGDGHGSFAESRNRLARWWRERFGLRAAPVVDNGSGLSRSERLTAASLAALLQQAAVHPRADVYLASLSLAGLDGTTRGMSRRNPYAESIGNAQLKTGTLRDVTAIAGYAYGRAGQRYAVVAFINHANAGAARPALDAAVEWAVQQP